MRLLTTWFQFLIALIVTQVSSGSIVVTVQMMTKIKVASYLRALTLGRHVAV
jgi:hypothetical protein